MSMEYSHLCVVGIKAPFYPRAMQSLQKTQEVLEHLVAFDTSSHKSNKPLIEWVKTYLEGQGVAAQTFDDATGLKQNLMATIGDPGGQGIVLSGHTDVVPAEAVHWSSDPFKLRLEDGKLFGRGTTDMKGFLSIVLAAVPDMAKRKLARPITLAFTYDEEVGCLGAPDLVERLPRFQRVIVGEPTSLVPGDRHKGGRVQIMTLKGVPAHSGTPELGVNAIAHAARALDGLAALELMGLQRLNAISRKAKRTSKRRLLSAKSAVVRRLMLCPTCAR